MLLLSLFLSCVSAVATTWHFRFLHEEHLHLVLVTLVGVSTPRKVEMPTLQQKIDVLADIHDGTYLENSG